MKNLKKLMERREELKQQLAALVDAADQEERAMTEEETRAFDAAEKEIQDIDDTLAREERARNIPTVQQPTEQHEMTVEERAAAEEKAFADFIMNRAMENRAGEIQLTQGNNGSIVPTTIANRIIKAVRDMVPFLQLADVVYTNGKLSVPVYGEDTTNYIDADYVDEGTDLTDNIGKFTTIDLTGFVIGALALVSNKLKDNTDINVVDFVINQVAEAMAEKLEGEFVNGTSGKITGIQSAASGVTAAAATAVTYDELVSLKHSLKQRFRGKASWIMNPATYTAICKLKDNNGQPYFKEDEYKILGRPVIESDSMPIMAAGKKPIIFGDLSGYTGCWKLENEPFYFVINDDFEWIAINLYGEQVGPGYVVDEGGCITLYMDDDTQLVTLYQTAYGELSDADGSTLTPMEYIMLLPTPEDELNQTAAFPGGFTNVTVDYPIQMEAHEHPNVSNALSFNAVMEDGTDDYYSNIMIAFQPISGFDP